MLQHGSRLRHDRLAEPVDEGDAGTSGRLDGLDGFADPRRGHGHLAEHDLSGGVPPQWFGAFWQQLAQHLVGGPAHGRDRRDAQSFVDRGPPRVVDPRRHLTDPEGLPGDPRRDDVGVVAAAHRREAVRALYSGPGEHVAVEANAGHPVALERRAEPAEGFWVAVDDGDRVPPVLQDVGERRAYSAATHDHDMHDPSFRGGRRAGKRPNQAPRQSYALTWENATPE
jgi:hypothetical protein